MVIIVWIPTGVYPRGGGGGNDIGERVGMRNAAIRITAAVYPARCGAGMTIYRSAV